jgi:hypothetical protein
MSKSSVNPVGEIALRLPQVEKGVACEGTSVERSTFKVHKKAFLFLGTGDAMVKLRESAPEARKLAGCKVGASGWTKVVWGPEGAPPLDLLKKWIDESYRLMAPTPKKAPRRK